ncbi:MAG: glycosyltransferase [Candidatus Peregrinibacteria bacterium]
MPSLSVIIPTHRRPEILTVCLQHLSRQTIAKDLEVIVVDDIQDQTAPRRRAMHDAPTGQTGDGVPTVKIITVPPCHQGTARNRGVELATASVILFGQDDIFLEPNACEKHLKAHGFSVGDPLIIDPRSKIQDPKAVLGFTTWDPALTVTPVMHFLEQSGWQFGYPKIQRFAHGFLPVNIQANFTYTSHISLPTDIAKRFPFREDVSLYGWEDIEWGMRLRDAGIRLFYEPDAKALHHHAMTLEDSLKRMETLGTSLVKMAKIVPEFRQKLYPWKLFVQRVLARFPTMSGRHRRAFLCGICDAIDKYR